MSGKPVCVADFEEYAKKFLPKSVYDYYRSGADDQETLADNVAAFARWKLYPRVLRDVSVMDLSTSVLGQKISMPVCVAATAMQRMAHADGETATAKGSDVCGGVSAVVTALEKHGIVSVLSLPSQGSRYVLAGGSPGLSTVGLRNLRLLKAAVEHHIPILAVFGPEIKGSTNNAKLYHPDIENFPRLPCVAHATRSALPFTSTGACSVYKACHAMGTGMMLSSWATSSIEEVAEAAPAGLRWLQLYVYKDREVTKSLVKRAERAGYKGIFVTVDTPFLGRRIDDVRNKFQLPPHLRLKNFSSSDLAFSSGKDFGENSGLAVYVAEAIDASVNWEDIKWLRGLTSLPIVAKGILRADDAKEAVKMGVNGILVSNHGARQLDGVPATIDVLPEIVEAVEGKVEVFLDGGVRKGTDVLKALALGAKAVFVGRPLIWGLVYQGEEGAKEVLQMLKEEFRLAMALTGCRRVEEIGRTLIRGHQVLFSKI